MLTWSAVTVFTSEYLSYVSLSASAGSTSIVYLSSSFSVKSSMGMVKLPSAPVIALWVTVVALSLGYFTITLAPAYAFPLLVPVFSLVSYGTITCPVIVTVPLLPVAVLSADALILPNGIVVAIINAIINHAAILFPFVLQNISIF